MTEHLKKDEIWAGKPWSPASVTWRVAMRAPLIAAAVNYFAWPLVTYVLPAAITLAGFNAMRLALMGWAGYAVARRAGAGFWGMAGAGIAIMLVDHVLLKGGMFLLYHVRGADTQGLGENSYLMAFGGVIVSFVMFSPVAGLAGLCGGALGRRARVRHAT